MNTIFEDTRRAVLYQNGKHALAIDLSKRDQLSDLLRQFFSYTEPDIATFEAAVQEFKQRIPTLAQGLLGIISEEHTKNRAFKTAFATFLELCRVSLDPQISRETIDEMLVQHLLTERLFRTIFNNQDFTSRNVIAAEIEKVIQALTSRAFNRGEFLKSLDRFYVAIEGAAKGLDDWMEKQHFLNTVYERFFQGFSMRQADTHGIVYTPQEIVDFMCASVEEVLKSEFGASLSTPGVQILDPCTGTGNFVVNLLRRISGSTLAYKYANDLFCNEIMLLPYYIASLNIEHAYYEKTGEYKPFDGICFTDTLGLAEGRQMPLFVEKNTERVEREKAAQIMVVIGNPPYNAWQKNENDNNKNRRYPVIDQRIRETYVKDSKATNRNALSDAYVKFFRWATDRLEGRDGIVCFISNNGFLEGIAFDGFRKRLVEEFTHIYHIDLGGNARKRGGGSIFGVKVGIGITILIRHRTGAQTPNQKAIIAYYNIADNQSGIEKLNTLAAKKYIDEIEWQELKPDDRHTWLTKSLHSEFTTFLSVGTKEAKASQNLDLPAIFRMYSSGVKTNRDIWTYDFNEAALVAKVKRFIETYNSEVDRWKRVGEPEDIDNFALYDDTKMKWSRDLKSDLKRKRYALFKPDKVRRSLYRPFTAKHYFFDSILSQDIFFHPRFFPTVVTEAENAMIVVSDHGYRSSFSTLATNTIPDLHLLASTDAFQCFPYYTYAEDGTNRRENITDWALSQFQTQYGPEVSKRDIFHYVYAMLHHPQYRERYAENLKRDLPRIPLLKERSAFETCVRIGKRLMELHLNYEQVAEYPLKWVENKDVPVDWRVEKMRLTPNKDAVLVNEWLTLVGLPPECFKYRLGNRSALEWVIDQYRVSTDARSGITSDPNRDDEPEYIVRLVGRVVTVSVETVKLVDELALAVRQEDWLGETDVELLGESAVTPAIEG